MLDGGDKVEFVSAKAATVDELAEHYTKGQPSLKPAVQVKVETGVTAPKEISDLLPNISSVQVFFFSLHILKNQIPFWFWMIFVVFPFLPCFFTMIKKEKILLMGFLAHFLSESF